MNRRVLVALVWATPVLVLVNGYPSEDAKLIASTLRTMSVRGKGNGQIPLVGGQPNDKCRPSQTGRVRFVAKKKVAQICTGSEWVTIVTTSKKVNIRDSIDSSGSDLGRNKRHPAKSCFHILKEGHSQGDGFYWIKHPAYPGQPYLAYCDMTTEGGGWTLFATKVAINYGFLIDKFSASSAHAVNQNGAGCIPIRQPWKQVLFRFRSDGGAARVVYNRYHGDGNKANFNKAISCGTGLPKGKAYTIRLGGFVKHSPLENGGRRVPKKGFHTIPSLAMKNFISEYHSHSNKWLDLWETTSVEPVQHYRSDDPKASGTKCIAGICHLKDPVWVMYR